jgi:F-type H+-transporting ATPase subunit a
MAKKKGCLGCSLPIVIIIAIIFLAVIAVGFLAGPIGQKMAPGLHFPGWLSAPQPEVSLPSEAVFHISGFPVTNTILATWLTMLVLVGLAVAVSRRVKLIPGRLQSMFEGIIGWIYDLCVSATDEKDGRTFFPLVATIFLFVIFNALFALLPGVSSLVIHEGDAAVPVLRGANTDVNTTLALALVSFCVFEFVGIIRLRHHYFGKFLVFGELGHGVKQISTGKVGQGAMTAFSGVLIAFAGILEGVSDFIRIVSLTFRLLGNMMAGEILTLSVIFLVPFIIPVGIYGFEMLFGFIQALVFSVLTIVYISLAVMPHESSEH